MQTSNALKLDAVFSEDDALFVFVSPVGFQIKWETCQQTYSGQLAPASFARLKMGETALLKLLD